MTSTAPGKLALCLSGGGLRATFFHLGVIAALRERGLLANVVELYSVSGGSITAGHLLKNWHRYCGSDAEFAEAVQDLGTLAGRDLRGRILRRWVLGLLFIIPRLCGLTRTSLLNAEYRRFFGRESISSHVEAHGRRPDGPPPPELHILATSFNTGELCSFSAEFFELDGGHAPKSIAGDMIPMHFAIAASSAFPPLFPPVSVDETVTLSHVGALPNAVALTDGGVYDNLGFRKFTLRQLRRQSRAEAVLISDAGGAFEPSVSATYSSLVARSARSVDILMQRLAEETIRQARAAAGTPVHHISIATEKYRSHLPTALRQRIQNIRTDLNVFSGDEVALLIAHGYGSAGATLGAATAPVAGLPFDPMLRDDDAHWSRVITRAARRRFGLFDLRDWTSYALGAVLLLLLMVPPGIYLAFHQVTREASALKDRLNLVSNDNRQLIDQFPAQAAAAPPPEASIERRQYRVWIQFAGSWGRPQIVALATALAAGWTVPDASRGGERLQAAAGLNEVRYGPDADAAAARLLAAEIDAFSPLKLPRPLKIRQVPVIPAKSLEVWISN